MSLYSYLLAKIHMVAKRWLYIFLQRNSYLLAKIHMVAKRSISFLASSHWLSSSKNPYGSKTAERRNNK